MRAKQSHASLALTLISDSRQIFHVSEMSCHRGLSHVTGRLSPCPTQKPISTFNFGPVVCVLQLSVSCLPNSVSLIRPDYLYRAEWSVSGVWVNYLDTYEVHATGVPRRITHVGWTKPTLGKSFSTLILASADKDVWKQSTYSDSQSLWRFC